MTRFDLTPLFRSTIGFDHLDRLFDSALQSTEAGGYPPYNIEKTGEDAYRLTVAVAGFGADEISIVGCIPSRSALRCAQWASAR